MEDLDKMVEVEAQRFVKRLLKKTKKDFPNLNNYDGIIYESDDLFWNIRTSLNEPSLTLNVNGNDKEEVESVYNNLCVLLKEIDHDLEI